MLLERANRSKIESDIVDSYKKIKDGFKMHERTSSAPSRSKLTVGIAELRIDHYVLVNKMIIHSRPVIRMVDEATNFCVALLLQYQSTKNIWNSIHYLWSLVYPGPLDILMVDQVTAYTSTKMRK